MSYKNTFQSWTDLNTIKDKITMFTVYAGGTNVFDRCQTFFNSFKYYKLGRVTIKLIPVSTLPVNPTEVATATTGKLDPRDLMTPGLVRITNGEDFFYEILENGKVDADTQRHIYDTMVMDPRWFKWNLQKGITKSAYPRFWVLGQLRQDYYPGSVINVPHGSPNYIEGFDTTAAIEFAMDESRLAYAMQENFSSDRGIVQTGRSGRMSWLPTDAVIERGFKKNVGTPKDKIERTPTVNNIPQIELFRVLLPPAHMTTFFYRMFITETVYFKEKVIEPPTFVNGNRICRVAPLDRFLRDAGTIAAMPNELINQIQPAKPSIPNDLEDRHKEQQAGQ